MLTDTHTHLCDAVFDADIKGIETKEIITTVSANTQRLCGFSPQAPV